MKKIYRTKIDLKVLGDEIKFVFFMSSSNKNLSKRQCLTLSYDTHYPVDSILQIKDGVERLFLEFNQKFMTLKTHVNDVVLSNNRLRLEIFKTKNGGFGFEKIIGNSFGAFLSHPNYFIPQNLIGALKPFGKVINGKLNALQMLLPSVKFTRNVGKDYSFDLDIHVNKCGQYVHLLKFKLNLEEDRILKGDIISIAPIKQITTKPQSIKLETTYLPLTQADLSSREILYDYKKQLTPQNVDSELLELVSSEVYVVKNPLNTNVNLSSLNLPINNNIEIPYNISRYVEDNKIKETYKIFKNGKYISPLNWASEIRDNDIFSSANKCISLKFSTKQQLESFTEKLKQQQIGTIETYPTLNNLGKVEHKPRTYSNISQWINRSQLNDFNDVRFTYDSNKKINTVLICPKKQSIISSENYGNQKGLHTKGNEYLRPDGTQYIGYYHIYEGVVMEGKEHMDMPHDVLTPLYSIAPISANTTTDFCFSTAGKIEDVMYSGFSAGTDIYATNNSYDLHLSGSSFSANTIIPISNVERKSMRLIDDATGEYRPYAFSETYDTHDGSLVFNETDANNYLIYSAKTDGIYRFTYKSYLNIKYTDTKWCEYLAKAYPSGLTITTGPYPSNDYQIKRLINTSIIDAGKGEKEVVSVDTGFKYNSGIRYRDCGGGREKYLCDNAPINTGILNFDFTAYLHKSTTTGNTGTTLTEFKILRNTNDGIANEYLTLEVNKADMSSSGANSCILSSVTSSTIFNKQIPITLDTGFINLLSGDTIQLRYDADWSATSKGGFYNLNGDSNVDINVGHKLNASGNTLECPYYRGIKSSGTLVSKKLFFDSTKKSLPFKMMVGDISTKNTLDGTLYISDSECGNIQRPTVTPNTFNDLIFLDSSAPDGKLVWDVTTGKPTNNWQKFIEDNVIKDYTLSDKNGSKMTHMRKNGIFSFTIPTYNNDYGAKCDFNFPQVSQSYIVVNKFKNYFGNLINHYIVITPECGFYKPCTSSKVATAYDILHRTPPNNWKVVRLNKKLNIKGKEITVVSSQSHYNPEPERRENKTKCQYYCNCGQNLANSLDLDPIYGITNIFNDLDSHNCDNCLENATKYCLGLDKKCRPTLIGDCTTENIYLNQVLQKSGNLAATFWQSGEDTSTTLGGSISGPGSVVEETTYYKCSEGLCFEDPNGTFTSLVACVNNCKSVPTKNPDKEETETDDGDGGGDDVCPDNQYWCDTQSMCINLDAVC